MKNLLLLILFPTVAQSQVKQTGYENLQMWEQTIQRAISQNKYILVDCFATWCLPCKQMDKSVFASPKVSNSIEKNFVVVKLQFDTTKRDSEETKLWHKISNQFRGQYKITGFPTFLFFSPKGEILHKEVGYQEVPEFLNILNDAIDSNKQVYRLLKKYNEGTLATNLMPYLAEKLKGSFQEVKLANEVASTYLARTYDSELINEGNLTLIRTFPQSLTSHHKLFKYFLEQGSIIDSVIREPGFAKKQVQRVVLEEEIFSKIKVDSKYISETPKWRKLQSKIRYKYGKNIAEEVVMDGKIIWFSQKKDWNKAIEYNVLKIEKFGLDTTFWGIYRNNNMFYNLFFKKSNEPSVLNKAVKWMEIIMQIEKYGDANSIDTYANLLYKLGKVKEAIFWQEKAIKLDPNNSEIVDNLLKMKNGAPTWE